jgi:two-component system NtrC family sensor kinase
MQAHLFQAEKLASIGKLAAGVAHEINNPLTGILTNSSLMLEDLPPEDPKREDVQTIVNETLRCRKIVKGLLDFARQTKPLKQFLDLNQVVKRVLSLIENQASFRNIAISTDLDPNPPAVLADQDQIQQVFLNIVLNASEAMPQQGQLRISSRTLPREGAMEVRFQDNGPGIPPDVQDKILEPFFTTKSTGTGLGLSIAYGIVERHRGTLKVESAPGKGTTIVITLPTESKEPEDG